MPGLWGRGRGGTGDSCCLAGANGVFAVRGPAVPGIPIACKAALTIFENELGAAGGI